ncbi:hypothetical protein EPN96_02135 [bacterium]|nr:MAG: hypothetical protein EPN96_02135 [bacterium]
MAFSPTKKKKFSPSSPAEVSIQITSLMDIFTTLLVFLMLNYAGEGAIVSIAESIKLPASQSQEQLHPAVAVAFNGKSLYVDGNVLIEDVTPYINSDEMMIEPLYAVLNTQAENLKKIAEVNKNIDFTGEILLQGDRQVPFRLLKKIIYTAGQAEYVNQSLVVFKEE